MKKIYYDKDEALFFQEELRAVYKGLAETERHISLKEKGYDIQLEDIRDADKKQEEDLSDIEEKTKIKYKKHKKGKTFDDTLKEIEQMIQQKPAEKKDIGAAARGAEWDWG